MLTMVQTLLPDPEQWVGVAAIFVAIAVFCGLGLPWRRPGDPPGVPIFAGWAIVSIVLTVVGVLTPWPFTPAFWIVVAVGGLMLAVVRYRGGAMASGDLTRIFILGLPLVVIIAAKVPSEVDSFTHWLPNGAYLLEHDGFLRPERPESKSVYPGFPYNATFLFYVVGRIAGGFIENTAIVFNVILILLFAGLLAWLIRRGAPRGTIPEWGLAALSLLAASLFNPVFVRRIWLASYPDIATSIVVTFSGIVGWLWIESLARREASEPGRALTFGLFLALLVNIKQANPVLVAGLVTGAGLIAWRDPKIGLGRFLTRLPMVLGAPLLLYACWRYYVADVTALRENEIQPIGQWPLHLLPNLLGRMVSVALHKSAYFFLAMAAMVWGIRALVRRPQTEFDRLTIIVGCSFLVYNLFLLFIFIAHFGGYPQSYWRYNMHIGYLVTANAVFGAALAWDRWGHDRLHLRPRVFRTFVTVLVIAVPLAEIALARYWRFDLEIPKPILRESGRELAGSLPADAVVLVLIPGDQGNFSAIIKHYVTGSRADLSVVEIAPEEGKVAHQVGLVDNRPLYVWSYCAQPWMGRYFRVPFEPGGAVLVRRDGETWAVERVWKHPLPGLLTSVYKLFDSSKCAGG